MDLYTLRRNNSTLVCIFWIDIGGFKVTALLDSGALISVAKRWVHEMAQRVSGLTLPITPLSVKTFVRAAMGHTQPIIGRAVLPIRLGTSKDHIDSDVYLQKFSILETLEYDVILGQDFLTNAGCAIDFLSGRVNVRAIDHSLQLFVPRNLNNTPPSLRCPVTYYGPPVTIPTGHLLPVWCQVGRKNTKGEGSGFFEPSRRHGIYSRLRPGAGPMDCPDDGRVIVYVLNTDDFPKVLHSHAILGTWIPLPPDPTAPVNALLPKDIYERLASLSLQPEHSYEDGVVLDVLAFTAEPDPSNYQPPSNPPPPEPPPEPPPGDSFDWPYNADHPPTTMDISDNHQSPEDINRVLNMSPEELKQAQLKVVASIDLSKSVLTDTQKKELRDLLLEFYQVWAVDNMNPHRTHVLEFTIPTGDAKPTQARPYRVSIKENAYIAEQVKQMLKNGIIRPSNSPWSSPVVLAPKPGGGIRFCVDYRAVNRLLPDDRRPLPLIQDILDSLNGAQFFSSLDLASAYWAVPINEDDKKKTAFVIQSGLFEFETMPFGLKNAPSTFQFLMGRVLAGHPTARPYLDDISVTSKTWEEHLAHLRDVFQRLVKAGLTLKASKCHFCLAEMPYLGHLAGPNGVRPNPEKTEEVRKMARPTKKKELRAFLGLAQYYRKFVLGFSHVAAPLYELLKLHAAFDWEDRHEQAFTALKEALATNHMLAYPDPNKPFTLYTDASDVGVGAVLAQEHDGVEKVVQYLSRKLDNTERKYGATEKECLGVVWAIEKCRPYLWGRHFTVVTDCVALRWLMTTADPNGRLVRWAMRLCEYDFTVKYRKGSTNANADALSRLFRDTPLERRYSLDGRGNLQDPTITQDPDENPTITPSTQDPTATQNPTMAMDLDDPADFRVDSEVRRDVLLRNVNREDVMTPMGNKAVYKTPDGDYRITAIITEPDDREWDPNEVYRLNMIQESNQENLSSPAPQPWLDEDLDRGLEVGEEEHDEYEITISEETIIGHMKEQQEEDEELNPIIKALQAKSEEAPDGYSLDERGRLVYSRRPGGNQRLVIPRAIRKHLLHEHHSGPVGAHMGRNKTRDTMTRRYYWPGMQEDIDEWIGTCAVCNRRKSSPYGRIGQHHPIKVTEPFAMWGMDLLTLPTSDQGNTYLLVMTEYFTRWVEAVPLPNKEATTVAGVVYREIFCRYGAPTCILTDHGGEFDNHFLTALCKAYGVKKIVTAVKKSSTNGLTERFNRTLWDMFAKKGLEEQTRWDRHVASCLYAYRSQVQASTGKSPYELLYGMHMKLPLDTAFQVDGNKWKPETRASVLKKREDLGVGNEDESLKKLTAAREQIREHLRAQAQQQLALRQAEQKKRWEAKARELQVMPGSKIHIRTERGNKNAKAKKIRLD